MSSLGLTITSILPLKNSSHGIPALGFGVYQSPPPTCVQSCQAAFRAGYRHVDTAQYYANESSVGRALIESKIPRSDFFITSKILSPGTDVDSTYRKIEESVLKLDSVNGYVDLYLIHSPNGGTEARQLMWKALILAKENGLVRDIGVSNYGIGHIEEMKDIDPKHWPPVVNQIELHPWCQQREIVEYCKGKGIVIEAYCPLVRNQKSENKILTSIATKHQSTPNRVLVRYCLQKGWVPLPKSDTPTRIASNADVYGIALDDEDMQKLDALDQGREGAIVQAVNNNFTS
ncbi:Aldo/keto reductase [Polyplosphaeria fusca]|uniref:Aldo/keto reductase n=1 Tax=Polyplosphaeria fusca TaxID=682080 RepID=A0A9P4V8D9_9PLEO|nr:Aldo/keto reductase [Polyplosphaeria fusca]